MARAIDVHVHLDAATYRRFCRFDAFRRQRKWYPPVLVSMVLVTLSLAGLFGRLPLPESASGVLMGLGLAVPMVFFGLFFLQIEVQAARQDLKAAPALYSLHLEPDGIRVTNDRKQEAPVPLRWDECSAAFRRSDAVYLYVRGGHAFILPAGQADVPDEALWAFLQRQLGAERCADAR